MATGYAASDQQGVTQEARKQVKKATSFWTKLSEDWVMNFSGMLAYNYLTAIAPILLALLAIGGLLLSTLSPAAYDAFVKGLATHFPLSGQSLINATLSTLRKEAGILLVIAIVLAVYSGSRLFVALDKVFAVVFRVDVRPFIRQNVMAILMMLLFVILAPLSFFAVSLPATVLRAIMPSGVQNNGFMLTIEGLIGGLAVTFVMFAAMYYVVPNRKLTWATVWPGALVASALMNLYELVFPIYQSLFLKNAGYGSVAGLAIVILIFLYYIGFISLLGAEINAWITGLRPLGATLPELFRQERRKGAGNAPGAPSRDISRTPPPAKPRGSADPVDNARASEARPSGGPQPAQAMAATRHDDIASHSGAGDAPRRARHARSASHTPHVIERTSHEQAMQEPVSRKIGRIARPVAAVTTVGAMLSAGAALAWRHISQQTQPSI